MCIGDLTNAAVLKTNAHGARDCRVPLLWGTSPSCSCVRFCGPLLSGNDPPPPPAGGLGGSDAKKTVCVPQIGLQFGAV